MTYEPSQEILMGMFFGIPLFMLMIGVALLAVWVWALIDIITSKFKESVMQVVWLLIVILLPFIGVVVYLLIGNATKISASIGGVDRSGHYEQLSQLKTLLDEGVISQEEFESEKAKILNG